MKPKPFRHYFYTFAKAFVPLGSPLFAATLFVADRLGDALSGYSPDPSNSYWGLLPGYLLEGIAFTLMLSALSAWLAATRKPISRMQDATGTFGWRYVDLQAPYGTAFDDCATILRTICGAEPATQDRDTGMLAGETPPTFWRPIREINIKVERLGEEITRVQVLIRPVIYSGMRDRGAIRRLADNAIGALKALHPTLAEG